MPKRQFCRNRLTTSGLFKLLYLRSLTDFSFLTRHHESAHFLHPGDTKGDTKIRAGFVTKSF